MGKRSNDSRTKQRFKAASCRQVKTLRIVDGATSEEHIPLAVHATAGTARGMRADRDCGNAHRLAAGLCRAVLAACYTDRDGDVFFREDNDLYMYVVHVLVTNLRALKSNLCVEV